MKSLTSTVALTAGRLWGASAPLTGVGVLMALLLVPAAVGLAWDPSIITGAPAWLKPAKFAASTAIYSLTLAWVFTWLPAWPRTRAWVGWTTAVVFVLEIAIVFGQAWRGTTSHFNVATLLDATLFAIMGAGIAAQTAASVLVAIALWREHVEDPAMGAALRAGMVITILGATTGAAMTRPTAAQLEEARATGRLRGNGAHTVGAADGGPGLPVTGWSTAHGDIRLPHFVGLHAVQILPIVAAIARRRSRSATAAGAIVRAAAASYAMLFGILLIQALRGESLVAPGTLTLSLLIGWGATTATALCAAIFAAGIRRDHHARLAGSAR